MAPGDALRGWERSEIAQAWTGLDRRQVLLSVQSELAQTWSDGIKHGLVQMVSEEVVKEGLLFDRKELRRVEAYGPLGFRRRNNGTYSVLTAVATLDARVLSAISGVNLTRVREPVFGYELSPGEYKGIARALRGDILRARRGRHVGDIAIVDAVD